MNDHGEPGDQYTPSGQILQAGAFAAGLRARSRRSRGFRMGLRAAAAIGLVLVVLVVLAAP